MRGVFGGGCLTRVVRRNRVEWGKGVRRTRWLDLKLKSKLIELGMRT